MSTLSKYRSKKTQKSPNYRAKYINEEKEKRQKKYVYLAIFAICLFLVLIITFPMLCIPFKDYRETKATVILSQKTAIAEHNTSIYSADLSFEVDGRTYTIEDKIVTKPYNSGEKITIYYNANNPNDTRPTTTEILLRLLFSAAPAVVAVILLVEGIRKRKAKPC